MKNYTKVFSAGMACVLALPALAQEASFDLSSQRSEIQSVLKVPGQKLNHNGIIINPVPHIFNRLEDGGYADLSRGIVLKDKTKKLAYALNFLSSDKNGVKVLIESGAKKAKKKGVKPVSGAYSLSITGKGIEIVGYDEAGAFYGIQTLRQLTESAGAAKQLPHLTIIDFPDLPNRGVVEGFYGTPWSHKVRLSLIDFYGKFKMNTYIYGPKDDPYHSSPNWRLPYPDEEAQHIKELVEACRKNYVNFVWAIHPGKDIKWNEEDYKNLLNKFNLMYDLGVRDFAIFFDDISGAGTNPYRQTELLNRLTEEFVKAKGDVSPLSVCPTDYSRLWANPTEKGSLAIYGKTLDPSIKVLWTGDVVCSDLTKETSDWVNSRIKRPNYFWWNFPVTDYVRHILLQGPVYGLDTKLSDQDVSGVVSNPMEHGEASKLALYGVADYTWNMSDYNALDNWERGLAELMPDAADAYRTFAIHSSDTENGYRRDESWETKTFRINNWDEALAEALAEEYDRVQKAPATIEKNCRNRALAAELKPWLTEFEKLGARGKKTIELMKLYRSNASAADFWNAYIGNLMSKADRKAYDAHKSGTMKLQPFYENAMEDMSHGFLTELTGEEARDFKGIGSFGSAFTPQIKLMLDNDSTTHYTSGIAQKAGDWIGVDLRAPRELKKIEILQGRNSKDDFDFFDHAILECSLDGKTWEPLIKEMSRQYVINWEGEGRKARYVRLRRLDSKRTNYAAVRVFNVNPVDIDNLGFKVTTNSHKLAAYAFDRNLNTSFVNEGKLSWEVLKGTKEYILLMNHPESPLSCRQYDAKGSLVAETTLNDAYDVIKVASDKVKTLTLEGKAEIFEVLTIK